VGVAFNIACSASVLTVKLMKKINIVIAFLASIAVVVLGQAVKEKVDRPSKQPGSARETACRVVERGENHSVWERISYEIAPNGRQVPQVHRYTELATGLNFRNAQGELEESKEEFELLPGKAVARQGQHKVTLNYNLNSAGAIEMATPDGKTLRSHVLGLSYFDTSSGQSVLIAEVKDSVGKVSGNQVIYEDAFTDFKADVRYTYTKAGFEQDIILREQPPKAEAYGLNPETTRLQVLTEFLNSPQPGRQARTLAQRDGKQVADEDLDFGAMRMGRGKAFSLGREGKDISVGKQWLKLEGRDFLVEEVPVPELEEALQVLPVVGSASLNPVSSSVRHVVSNKRLLPAPKLAKAGKGEMKVATLASSTQGLVLDYYVTLNSGQANFTFQGGTTYYISGWVNLSGTTIFEGGTVVKYMESGGGSLNLNGPFNCLTAPYRPAVFTSMNDDSVGATISGSTGQPGSVGQGFIWNNYSATNALYKHLRFLYGGFSDYANQITGNGAVYDDYFTAEDVQFANCGYAIDCGVGSKDTNVTDVFLKNVLFAHCGLCVGPDNNGFQNPCVVRGTQVTVADCQQFAGGDRADNDGASYTFMTNSIFADTPVYVPAMFGDHNGFYNSTEFGANPVTNTFFPFQSVGAGNYYLTNGCGFFDAGTNNIDAAVLAGLRKKTTYPPVLLTNLMFFDATNFSAQAPRDTNAAPDLGYHYDPIDYLFSNWGVGGASGGLTFTPGTVVGGAISVLYSGSLTFQGNVTQPCWFVGYDTVQEGGNTPNWPSGFTFAFDSSFNTLNAQFTKFSALSADNLIGDGSWAGGSGVANVGNCEFYSAEINIGGAAFHFTNCLFSRVNINVNDSFQDGFVFQNCLVWQGNFSLSRFWAADSPWIIRDSAFDGQAFQINDPSGGDTNYTCLDYNAFLTNADWTGGSHDVVVSNFNWQGSWLGDYYQPTNSLLINAGSRTADLAGLYHYTTTTNQVKETNSIVDIGYHYVAVDINGNPFDHNGDGMPDYLEDANGNGLVDAGETPWLLPPTANLTSPANGQFFNAYPTNLTLIADAGNVDGNVVSVAFYNGTSLLGSDTVAPYTLTWSNVTFGTYALTAVATDNNGLVTTSSVVNVTVDAPPSVSVTSPANGTVIITPTNLTISASAYDSEGSVTQLQIFAGTNLLGTSGASSFSLVWSNVPPGTWNLTAVATDNLGAIGTSSAVTITANPLTNLLANADAHVRDGSYSNTNFGTNLVMECQTTNGSGNNRDIYFKFDVSNISSNISSAQLKVFAAVSTSGTVTNNVYAVTNTSWVETTITWSNKPARGTALRTNTISGTNGSWYWYDVTTYVRTNRAAGRSAISLALHDPVNTTRLVKINSKENTNPPAMVIVTTNPPPTVSIIAPTNNAVYAAPAGAIAINANAGDDGGVRQVQFFAGVNSLGIDTSSPYSETWSNVAAGIYTLKAVATDNYGLSATSGVVNVIVDIPPVVTLTNPANNTLFVAGSNIVLGATATDVDGTVKQVQFFGGTTSLGIDTNAPYSVTWSNAPAGTYALTAVAMDNNGITTTSGPVSIFIDAPPSVSITSPTNNTSIAQPAGIVISANASDSDGIAWVRFYAGSLLLGTCTNAPYSVTWNNPPLGVFVLTAVAVDIYGVAASASVTNITVNANLPAMADAHVRDGSYSNANYGTVSVMEVQTSTGTGTNRDTYFKFDVSNISSNISSAQLKVFAAVSTTGTVTNTVYAVTNTSWGETTITWSNKPARGTALRTNTISGTNGNWYLYDVTTYVRTNRAAGRTNISFALHDPMNTTRLVKINSKENTTPPALVIVTTNAPTVSIAAPTNNAVYAALAGSIPISATVAPDGSMVQFFAGATSLGIDTDAPYSMAWSNVPAGNYPLTAVAVDYAGRSVTSGVVNIIVDVPPVVTLTNPVDHAILAPGSNVSLAAAASDSDGIKQLQFFQGTTSLGIDTNAPYSVTWSNLSPGVYALTAVAVDALGLAHTSSVVTVFVGVPPTITQQPASQTVTMGTNASFSVVADGTPPLSYQWQHDGLDIPGATNATLTIISAQPADGGVYRVVVSNFGGSMQSAPVTLAVESGARYYVSTTGSDTNLGTSLAQPFKTVQKAFDTMVAGDSVYIRGGTYRETQTANGVYVRTNHHGWATNRILISAYSNEVAVLKGSEIVTGWTYVSNGIWMKTNWPYKSQQVFVHNSINFSDTDEGYPLQQVGMPNEFFSLQPNTNCGCVNTNYTYYTWVYDPPNRSTATTVTNVTMEGTNCTLVTNLTVFTSVAQALAYMHTNPGTFFNGGFSNNQYVGTSLYVHLPDGSDPNTKGIEASARNFILFNDYPGVDGVWPQNRPDVFLHIKNLRFRHSNITSANPWPDIFPGNGCIFENCDAQWCDYAGIQADQILNCNLSNNGDNGGSGTLVYGCTIAKNNYRNFNTGWHAGGMKFIAPSYPPITIEYCNVSGNNSAGIWFDSCTSGSLITIRNNYFTNNSPAIMIETSTNAAIYNNIIVGSPGIGIFLSTARGVKVYNNTVIGTLRPPEATWAAAIFVWGDVRDVATNMNNEVRNNIIYNPSEAATYDLIVASDGCHGAANNTSDYNCFYRTNGPCIFSTSCISYSGLSQWSAATGFDTHSTNCDPQFVNAPAGDFRLQPGSPLVDRGQSLPIVPFDYQGTTRPQGAGYDMGAYER
jgi:parallel beta-helix repeat protein